MQNGTKKRFTVTLIEPGVHLMQVPFTENIGRSVMDLLTLKSA